MKKIIKMISGILVFAIFFACINAGAVVPGENVTEDMPGDFQKLDISVVANKINISGISGAAEVARITFYMVEGTSIVYVKEIYTDADGTFEETLVLIPSCYNADNQGILIIGSTNANTRKIEGIELYSQSELDDCVSAFTSISSTEDMSGFLELYADMLGISNEYNQNEMELMYEKYTEASLEDINDCDSVIKFIENIVTYVDDYREFFAKINEAAQNGDGAEIRNLINNTYREIIPFETELHLIQNEGAVYQKIADGYTEEFTSFEELKAAFDAAILEQKNEEAVNGYIVSDRSKGFVDEAWKLSIYGNYIIVSGKTDDAGKHNIVFSITDYDVTSPAILGFYQTKTLEDGSFTAEFALESDLYEDETKALLQISGLDRNTYQFCIPLYHGDVLNAMRDEFLSIDDEDAMKDFLDEYSTMLNVGIGYSLSKAKILYEVYTEEDFSELVDSDEAVTAMLRLDSAMTDVKAFVDSMNDYSDDKLWGHIQEAIEVKNENMIEKSKSFAELRDRALKNKTVSKKGLYMRMVGLNFECVRDISDAYDKAYEEQKKFEETSVNTSSKPGGSSGGGGGFNMGIAPELIPETSVPVLETEKAPVESFKDIEGYKWAETAINGLRNLSIVRGDGKGNYRPGDRVTREEFLSMLLATCYIETKSGEVPFGDVEPGMWYSDVISTGYSLGITNGKSDGTFGVGESIIRADMVTLAARLLEQKGLELEIVETATIFEDFPSIPEYAYNNVIRMQQAGLVHGDETGKFNPMNALTRAEAAVFFWNVYNYIEGQI